MKNILLLISLFFITFDVFAGAGTFPQGDHVKLLKDKVQFKNNLITIMSNQADPFGIGVNGERGSIFMESKYLFFKHGTGANDWTRILNAFDAEVVTQTPDFENSSAGWTISTTCTPSYETLVPYFRKSLKFVCSGEDFSVKQETTSLVGSDSQLYMDAKVQASAAGVIARTLEDGSEQSAITLSILDKMTPVSIPATVGATSNGIEIYATSYTGTVYIDDFKLSIDDRRMSVPVISKGNKYNPTVTGVTGASTSEGVFWRQVGNKIDIWGTITQSTATASTFSITLPSGLTVDSSQLSAKTNGNAYGGFYNVEAFTSAYSSTTGGLYPAFSDTSVANNIIYAARDSSAAGFTKNNGDDLFTSGGRIVIDIKGIPVNELSATPASIVSQKTSFPVVTGANNGGETITANVTNIPFIEVQDKDGAWDGSTFTAPQTGNYSIIGVAYTIATTDTQIRTYVDGSLFTIIGNSANSIRPFAGVVPLIKGQVLSLRFNANLTLQSNVSIHTIHIQKIPDEAWIAGKFNNLGDTKADTINLTSLPTYADDTAAGSGGLVQGDVYQTATGELRIKL